MSTLRPTAANQLRLQSETLALEMFNLGEMFSAIGEKIRNALATIIPSFRSSKEVITDDNGHVLGDLPMTRSDTAFIAKVNRQPYYILQDMPVYVPQGLKVSYLEYLEQIAPAVERCTTFVKTVLMPYKDYLTQCLGTPDALLTTDDHAREYIKLDSTREIINKKLGECFSKNEHVATVPFHQAIGAPADMHRIYQATMQASLKMNSVSRQEMQSLIDQCADLLALIYDNLKKHPDSVVAKEAAKRMASGAYQVARELEFYSITYFRILTVTGSLDNTRKHFEENL